MRVLSVGELLWDIYPDNELLGGAALNFAVNTHRFGAVSALLTAVGDDTRGHKALSLLSNLGLVTECVQVLPSGETGTAAVRLDANGVAEFCIRRPAAYDLLLCSEQLWNWASGYGADWIYVGTLLHMNTEVERFTTGLVQRCPGLRCLYDVNLRPGCFDLQLVKRLCGLASVVKVNEAEARMLFAAEPEQRSFSLQDFCAAWAERYALEAVCVTRGADGCCVFVAGELHRVAGYPVKVVDTVGSGDAFAAAFAYGYHHNWSMLESTRVANAAGALVASRAGAIPEISLDECLRLAHSGAET